MTDFLYPFLDASEHDEEGLLADLSASALDKSGERARLVARTLADEETKMAAAADAMAARFAAGGRLLTFGNGGSATDAATLAQLFRTPPDPGAPPLPALCLVEDPAVLTALANDVGSDLVYSRQLMAQARPQDIAVGMSTSGGSRNLLIAFGEAKRRGLLTAGLAGYDGGEMAVSADVDHCLVVRSESVHRIQEAQAAVGLALWSSVQARLGAGRGT